jgi:2-iminoacetate synthase
MTLAEYLVDYASDTTRERGFSLIAQELERIPNAQTRDICTANIEAIKSGDARDLRV